MKKKLKDKLINWIKQPSTQRALLIIFTSATASLSEETRKNIIEIAISVFVLFDLFVNQK